MGVHFQLHLCPGNAEHAHGAIAVPCHHVLALSFPCNDGMRLPGQALAALEKKPGQRPDDRKTVGPYALNALKAPPAGISTALGCSTRTQQSLQCQAVTVPSTKTKRSMRHKPLPGSALETVPPAPCCPGTKSSRCHPPHTWHSESHQD